MSRADVIIGTSPDYKANPLPEAKAH